MLYELLFCYWAFGFHLLQVQGLILLCVQFHETCFLHLHHFISQNKVVLFRTLVKITSSSCFLAKAEYQNWSHRANQQVTFEKLEQSNVLHIKPMNRWWNKFLINFLSIVRQFRIVSAPVSFFYTVNLLWNLLRSLCHCKGVIVED